eukprot:EG_transcript_29319
MALQLPDDVWLLVSDFAVLPALARLTRRHHRLLARRHLVLRHVSCHSMDSKLLLLTTTAGAVWSLALHFAAGSTAALVARVPWPLFTSLQSVSLQSDSCRMTDERLLALRCLAELAGLRSLHLSLMDSALEASGAAFLASLAGTLPLHTLELDLSWNDVTDRGAEALATLRASPTLRTVLLALRGCAVTARGAHALARLAGGGAPPWRRLRLWLQQN